MIGVQNLNGGSQARGTRKTVFFLFRSKRPGVKNENSEQFSVTSFVAYKHNILVKPTDNKVLIKISV
jgi:hypothetical protein